MKNKIRMKYSIMKKRLFSIQLYTVTLLLGMLLFNSKAHSQCDNCNSNYPSGTKSTTSATWSLVTNYQEDDEYSYYSLNSSYMYQWRTSYYSTEGAFDTELTLYPSGTCDVGYHLTYDDDGSDGTYSCMSYSGSTTSVRVLCSYYACSTTTGRRVNHHWRAIPKNPTISGGGTTICLGSSVTLTASNIGLNDNFVKVYWGTSSGGTQISSDATSVSVSPTSTTTYYLRYVLTGYNGESGSQGYKYSNVASTTITVRQPPTAPTGVLGTATICEGNNVTLTATGGSVGSGATYQWYAGGCGSGSVLGTGVSINVSPTTTTTYYVRRVGNSPCNSTVTSCASGTVIVNAVSVVPSSIGVSVNP